jgi:hypothetical protein
LDKLTIRDTEEYKVDTNHCTVCTLAVIADIPFDEAQAVMAAEGRKFRKGMYDYQYLPVYKKFCKLKEIEGYEDVAVSAFMRRRKHLIKNNTVIIKNRGHIFAVQNGEIEDWMDSTRRHRIKQLWVVKGRKKYDHTDDYIKGREIIENEYKTIQKKKYVWRNGAFYKNPDYDPNFVFGGRGKIG